MSQSYRPGYVYLLQNPSMPGLVKIGRSTRPSEQRVTELSAPTGVPTPFELVFDVFVSDCVDAEALIHAKLTERGYRYSEHREFFDVPIRDAVNLMVKVKEQFPAVEGQDEPWEWTGWILTGDEVRTPEERRLFMRRLEREEARVGWEYNRNDLVQMLRDLRDEIRKDRDRFYREAAELQPPSWREPTTKEKILKALDRIEKEQERDEWLEGMMQDDLFNEAAKYAVATNSGSTSLVQRKLRVGYGRAARLINQLAYAGILGPSVGAQPREVLVGRADLCDMLGEEVDWQMYEPESRPWWKFWA